MVLTVARFLSYRQETVAILRKDILMNDSTTVRIGSSETEIAVISDVPPTVLAWRQQRFGAAGDHARHFNDCRKSLTKCWR